MRRRSVQLIQRAVQRETQGKAAGHHRYKGRQPYHAVIDAIFLRGIRKQERQPGGENDADRRKDERFFAGDLHVLFPDVLPHGKLPRL